MITDDTKYFGDAVFKKLYSAFRKVLYMVVCKLKGEIYFSKYDELGAYHWINYYDRKDMLYVELVDTVCSLVPSNTKVLDIGCGDGLISNVLSETKNCQVTGIDNHPIGIQLAKQKNKNANMFFCNSAYRLNYKKKFDVIIAIEIYEHLKTPQLLLKKAYKAMTNDGILIISTPISAYVDAFHVKNYSIEEFELALTERFSIVERKDPGKSSNDSQYYTHICVCTKKP